MIDKSTLWLVIFVLGIGSFLLRFSFMGWMGDRPLPEWALRYLRYTAVAIIPALLAPMVVFSNQTETGPEPVRLIAAIATLTIGIISKSVIYAILTGAAVLAIGTYAF